MKPLEGLAAGVHDVEGDPTPWYGVGADIVVRRRDASVQGHGRYLACAVDVADVAGVDDAILARDYPVVQVAVLVITLIVALINLIVDVSYIYLDPRIRYE